MIGSTRSSSQSGKASLCAERDRPGRLQLDGLAETLLVGGDAAAFGAGVAVGAGLEHFTGALH